MSGDLALTATGMSDRALSGDLSLTATGVSDSNIQIGMVTLAAANRLLCTHKSGKKELQVSGGKSQTCIPLLAKCCTFGGGVLVDC